MNNALQQVNSTIKGLTERILAEEAKLQDGRRELREKLNLDMERVQRQVKIEEENLRYVYVPTPNLLLNLTRTYCSDCQSNIANIHRLVQTKKDEWKTVAASRERMRTDITSAQDSITRLHSSQQNQINAFGTHLDRAVVDIGQARWHGEIPVGPLGLYVEVKTPRWIQLMQVNLGNLMASFAVTDVRDREPLSRILQKHGNK
jgi:chromosome segregation ATPase